MIKEVSNLKLRGDIFIPNFRFFPPQALEAMKADLRLEMPMDLLMFIQKHYAEVEKRDMVMDELAFLDRYFAAQKRNINNYALFELETNDDFIAETYSDMQKKRSFMNGGNPLPFVKLDALASVANDYLRAVGVAEATGGEDEKSNKQSQSNPSVNGTFLLLYDNPVMRDADGRSIYSSEVFQTEINSDTISDRYKYTDFKTAVNDLLSEENIKKTDKVYAYPECGVISFILENSVGAVIDISVLPVERAVGEIPYPPSMSALCESGENIMIFKIPAFSVNMFDYAAKTFGLSVSVIGHAASAAGIVFRAPYLPQRTIEADFLRKLISYIPARAVIDTKSDTSKFGMNSYINGMNAVINAAIKIAVQGVNTKKPPLMLNFTLTQKSQEPDSEDIGRAVALLLGAYRAQTELCLPCEYRISTLTNANSLPYAEAVIPEAPDAFDCDKTEIAAARKSRLESIPGDKNGIPDFALVRSLIKYEKATAKSMGR